MKIRSLARMGLTLLIALCLYVLLMTLAYAFPDSMIADNVQAALGVYAEEGDYAQYFFGYPYGQMDNMTDECMFRTLLRGDNSALKAAMVPDYARYWHGYALLLRPLSVVLNVVNLRYLNMLWMMGLLCASFCMAQRRLGWAAALAYLGGLLTAFVLISPFCFQYATVFTLTMLFSLILLAGWDQTRLRRNLPTIFLLFGSLTHFFDFLTFPILTLAYPLTLCLLLRRRENEGSFKTEALFLLGVSAAWCAGYGLTLLAKGLIGTLITGENVLGDIASNVSMRVGGELAENFREPLSLGFSLRKNLGFFFHARTLAATALGLAALGAGALIFRRKASAWLSALPILGVALYPLVWYAVLQNHSVVHAFFTSKSLAAPVFAMCT